MVMLGSAVEARVIPVFAAAGAARYGFRSN
jgi:hypothetical protein